MRVRIDLSSMAQHRDRDARYLCSHSKLIHLSSPLKMVVLEWKKKVNLPPLTILAASLLEG